MQEFMNYTKHARNAALSACRFARDYPAATLCYLSSALLASPYTMYIMNRGISFDLITDVGERGALMLGIGIPATVAILGASAHEKKAEKIRERNCIIYGADIFSGLPSLMNDELAYWI